VPPGSPRALPLGGGVADRALPGSRGPCLSRIVTPAGIIPNRRRASKPAFTRTGGSDLIMTAADRFVGIDSSQGRLDVAVTPGDQTFTHPNTEAGIQKLIHRSWPEAKRPR
jgi:hypothetical protein